jgi:hypothetical protein
MPLNGRIRKVTVIGAQGVGKTSLIRRYVYGRFSNGVEQGGESAVYRKRLSAGELIIWELGTEEQNPEAILRGSSGVVVVLDVTDEATLEWANEVLPYVSSLLPGRPIAIAGNKCDMKYAARLWRDDIEPIASRWNAALYMTSARTGENVAEVFAHINPDGRS